MPEIHNCGGFPSEPAVSSSFGWYVALTNRINNYGRLDETLIYYYKRSMQRKGHQSIKMSLSEEDRLLLNDNYRIRIYGSVDDSSSSDTLLSSGSFQVKYVDKVQL